jgi:chromosome segregation ATPase
VADGGENLDAKQAEAAAKLTELMAKLKDAQARLDAMVSESRTLQRKLREIHAEDQHSPNGS